ncbi:hypothetical protein M405DRAFT_809778 [Rhizopogon salebrosus TDB-379]|nr:hypothetical protein M405DRAFT_809778 [Rhizopogon salebrosus TDB-379]
MIYSKVLSLICTSCMLLILCTARVVVRDTVTPAASSTYHPVSGALWAPSIHDKIVLSKVHHVDRNAADARSTPVGLADISWKPSVNKEVSPSRGRALRENEPVATPIKALIWQSAVREEIASKRSAVQRAEIPENTPIAGLLWEGAVHEKIPDS